MKKNTLFFSSIIIIIVAIGAWSFARHSSMVSDSAEIAHIRAEVIAFGQKLKLVSILGPDFENQIQTEYGSYVDPTLLARWKESPDSALGRATSTPYPDRIEITTITKQDDATYTVLCTVIEVGADSPRTLASYPVTLTLKDKRGSWLISDSIKGDYFIMGR